MMRVDRLERYERFVERLSHSFNWVAGVGMVAMLAVTVADVVGVKAFKTPVPGGIEVVGFLGVIATAFAIAYTKIVRGHIQVDFFIMRLPRRGQAGLLALVSLFGLALFVVLAWRSFDYARILQTTGEVSMTQRLPFYPFVYALALACIPVCLVLFAEFLRSVRKAVKA